jgi:hypothetical protein
LQHLFGKQEGFEERRDEQYYHQGQQRRRHLQTQRRDYRETVDKYRKKPEQRAHPPSNQQPILSERPSNKHREHLYDDCDSN